MSAQVVAALMQRNWKIAFAESCTGGLATSRLVDVPDASRVLDASVVTYANEAKISYLGVDPETLRRYGAVSEQVAGQMAQGVAQRNGAQVGVGISGIAGPGGGTEEKPVGTVCFGFWVNGVLTVQTCYFGNLGRNPVRVAAVDFVYSCLRELL